MSSSQNSLSSDVRLTPDAFTPLHDVVCNVDVMLASTEMSVRDCMNLRRDSIIRLSKLAGGHMQVAVNGVLIAYGEVVIVDESTAIRVTEVVAPPSNEVAE